VAGFIQARDVNQEKKMPLTECGVGRGTGRPREKSNLKKREQSVKKGREGLTLGASQWYCRGVEECRKPKKNRAATEKKVTCK